MPVFITPFFTSLLALVFLFLSVRVVGARRSEGIGLGDQGNDMLLRRIRSHGNFAEYVPISLLLMLMLELMGAAPWLLFALGIMLLAGRVLHAYSLQRLPQPMKLRVAGTALTFTTIGVAALALLALALNPVLNEILFGTV